MFEMKIKRSKAEQAFNIFNIILMFVLMVVTLYPLLYVLFASLSDASKLMQHSGLLFKPLGLNLSSYKIVIQDRQILSGYMNNHSSCGRSTDKYGAYYTWSVHSFEKEPLLGQDDFDDSNYSYVFQRRINTVLLARKEPWNVG